MSKHRTRSLKETHDLAGEFIKKLKQAKKKSPNSAHLIGLYGDLGSGKTAFVQGVAKALGWPHPITSPTFVLQKTYSLPDTHYPLRSLVHIDAYRLSGGTDLKPLRFAETLADPTNLVFLEWPELVADALPDYLIPLRFTFVDEETREIELPEI